MKILVRLVLSLAMLGLCQVSRGEEDLGELNLDQIFREYLKRVTNHKHDSSYEKCMEKIKYEPFLASEEEEFKDLLKNSIYLANKPYSLNFIVGLGDPSDIDLYSADVAVKWIIWERPLGLTNSSAAEHKIVGLLWKNNTPNLFEAVLTVRFP